VIWKRTRQSNKDKQDQQQRQIKQADLEMLELAAAAGEIELKYLDESGFCMWSPVSYTYFPRGQQKHLAQTRRRGRRLSILGVMQPLISFVYGLVIGAFTSDSYLKLMESVAQTAYEHLVTTGCITVVVQDNGPIHTSSKLQQRWSDWEKKGLYIFFLPKYCSEMNRIELEWHQLKTHELARQMFVPHIPQVRTQNAVFLRDDSITIRYQSTRY